jgi:hypothetical protein
MSSKIENVVDSSGAPVLNENDEIITKDVGLYKYWGSYQQGFNKPVIKQTQTCENRFTYFVVTNIGDETWDITINLSNTELKYDSGANTRQGLKFLILILVLELFI